MLCYTQEEAVEIAGPARNSGLQPLVGEGFDRFNQSQGAIWVGRSMKLKAWSPRSQSVAEIALG